MDASLVDAILQEISKHWSLSNDCEITLEANPTSSEARRFQAYRTAGVNRVSIGVQSLNQADLTALGRLHTVNEALQTIEMAGETFERTSFDLIYARQNQTLKDWETELEKALALKPDHLSLYQLTIEDGTAFGDRHRNGRLSGLPDDDLAADMYFATQSICEAADLPAYEVSNHAKTGSESRHNQIYWQSGDYIGIGPGAHGRLTIDKRRYATETELQPMVWLKSALKAQGELSRDSLSVFEVGQEKLLMGLRLASGIILDTESRSVTDLIAVQEMEGLGLLHFSNDRLQVSKSGRPVLNGILRAIVSTD